MDKTKAISDLKARDHEIVLLYQTQALLLWDQETFMPPAASGGRAEQVALLEGLLHDRQTDPAIGECLASLCSTDDNPAGDPELSAESKDFLRIARRAYSKKTRIPKELAVRLAKETSEAQSIWVEARSKDEYGLFAPRLQILLDLLREKADRLGWKEHPYDALLDEYEPWMTTAELRRVFTPLESELSEFVRRISSRPAIDDSFLSKEYAIDRQKQLGDTLLADLGFDTRRGRLDITAHPFTTTLGFDDVRLTTRYAANNPLMALFGTIHEAGHGLYELGFDPSIRGSCLATGTTNGIHESQSRLWENVIGRGLPFWTRYFPVLRKLFPENLTGVSLESFYRAVNKVAPSHIRINADEVTYGLHIILRFNLEVRLVEGQLAVKDIPDAWRAESKRLLGIEPETDAMGCLQDVHWSTGGIGYFPTYALGNLYAAQFSAALRRARPGMDAEISAGDFSGVLEWLRENIHRHGSTRTASELCLAATGEKLDPAHFIRYLADKFGGLYGI